jgi:8-oxo-dGTP pyrophosphatase MutT (NUDIX family)
MLVRKACPIVLRHGQPGVQILLFVHPLAGIQLVKGTIDTGESDETAALRELREESGVEATIERRLGSWDASFENQVWALLVCSPTRMLPDGWTHRTQDDSGHDFRFFWHPLHQELTDDHYPVYRRALQSIAARLISP